MSTDAFGMGETDHFAMSHCTIENRLPRFVSPAAAVVRRYCRTSARRIQIERRQWEEEKGGSKRRREINSCMP